MCCVLYPAVSLSLASIVLVVKPKDSLIGNKNVEGKNNNNNMAVEMSYTSLRSEQETMSIIVSLMLLKFRKCPKRKNTTSSPSNGFFIHGKDKDQWF